jgi:peptidoglycan/xylan/chitin deacetylase (PgdA/CDA1 family)
VKTSPVVLAAAALIVAAVGAGCSAAPAPDWTFRPVTGAVAPAQPTGGAPSQPPIATESQSPAPDPSPSRLPSSVPRPTPTPVTGPTARPSDLTPLADLPVPPGRIPILYYHRVQPIPAAYPSWSAARRRSFTTYDTLPQAFEAQLDWLRDHGYTTILPRDLAAHWSARTPLPARPVIITFDDGSRDWVTRVLPMLKARGMVAEFYLTLDAIKHGNLTWAQVRRLAAAGNGIGAHDVHHVQLAALGPGRKPASTDVMWAEINDARTIIGANVGVDPDSMAYVGGGFDATLQRLVEEAGYTTARSILRGVVQDPDRRFALRVVRVGVHDDVVTLVGGALVPGLPTFTARMADVPDR